MLTRNEGERLRDFAEGAPYDAITHQADMHSLSRQEKAVTFRLP